MPEHIPFYSLEQQHAPIRSEIHGAIEKVIDSNQLVLGNSLSGFERGYAAFVGVPYCAGVANGVDAIALSLRALGVGSGDEVIVPSNTCIATWMAVSAVDATIIPVEPNLATFNIDANVIQLAITSRTRAIVPVHLYGQCCDMQSIIKVAEQHSLLVVEDCAQAHGSSYNGKTAGSFGNCNATSFYPTKNLGALGDAGAVTTDDHQVFERVVALRNYGSVAKSIHTVIGSNSRMDELQAAILEVKLKYVEQWNQSRAAIAHIYLERLSGLGDLVLPFTSPGSSHVYHQFVVRTSRRDDLAGFLANRGIGTMIHYPIPPHLQQAYASLRYTKGSFPIAEEIAGTCLSLPVWPGMTDEQVELVGDSVRSFWA